MSKRDPRPAAPYNFKPGIGDFPRQWGGVRRQDSISAIPPNYFYDLINGRFAGSDIVNRGGQSKLNSGAAVTGCVRGIYDLGDPNDSATKMWIGGTLDSVGDLVSYNPTDSPTLQLVINDSGLSGPSQCLFIRDGKLHFFLDSDFYELIRIATPSGSYMSAAAGTSHKKVFTPSNGIPASATTFTPGDGNTYLASDTHIYSWDGVTLTTDFASGTGLSIIARYREDMYAAGTNEFRRRSGGTWGTIAMPGGLTAPVAVQGSWAVYKDVLYTGWDDDVGAGNHRDRILSYDGTTHAVARSLSSGTNAQGIIALLSAFGYLYYFYSNHNDANLTVGRFDGSTWTDSHKIIGAQSSLDNPSDLRAAILNNNNIYAVVIGGTSRLIRSAGSSTGSDWVSVATGVSATQNSIAIL